MVLAPREQKKDKNEDCSEEVYENKGSSDKMSEASRLLSDKNEPDLRKLKHLMSFMSPLMKSFGENGPRVQICPFAVTGGTPVAQPRFRSGAFTSPHGGVPTKSGQVPPLRQTVPLPIQG
jgi:hypothetical protein